MNNRNLLNRVKKLEKKQPEELPKITIIPCHGGSLVLDNATGEKIEDENLIKRIMKAHEGECFNVVFDFDNESDVISLPETDAPITLLVT